MTSRSKTPPCPRPSTRRCPTACTTRRCCRRCSRSRSAPASSGTGPSPGSSSSGSTRSTRRCSRLGLLLHGSTASYVRAVEDGARGCAGVILQFPLYAGIMGLLAASGLIDTFSRTLADFGSSTMLPVMTFVSAGVVNLFVPSGGGQWGIQGPIALESGAAAGVSAGKMIMAVAYGDQLTNMLQPFWALPLLAITGVKARDIVGYTAVVMAAAAAWIALWLLVL
ncbi:MAG: TIGR00366 family protein [Phycisphaerales bacterium]